MYFGLDTYTYWQYSISVELLFQIRFLHDLLCTTYTSDSKKNPLFFYHVLSWHVQIKLSRLTFQIKLFSFEKPMYFSKNISLFFFVAFEKHFSLFPLIELSISLVLVLWCFPHKPSFTNVLFFLILRSWSQNVVYVTMISGRTTKY